LICPPHLRTAAWDKFSSNKTARQHTVHIRRSTVQRETDVHSSELDFRISLMVIQLTRIWAVMPDQLYQTSVEDVADLGEAAFD